MIQYIYMQTHWETSPVIHKSIPFSPQWFVIPNYITKIDAWKQSWPHTLTTHTCTWTHMNTHTKLLRRIFHQNRLHWQVDLSANSEAFQWVTRDTMDLLDQEAKNPLTSSNQPAQTFNMLVLWDRVLSDMTDACHNTVRNDTWPRKWLDNHPAKVRKINK